MARRRGNGIGVNDIRGVMKRFPGALLVLGFLLAAAGA
jgi:hypothetical protein